MTDDWGLLQGLIDHVDDWTPVNLRNESFGITKPLDLSKKHGVTFQSANSAVAGLTSVKSLPEIVALNDMECMVRFGNITNVDPVTFAGLRYSIGSRGIAYNCNGKKFADAPIVMEGVQYPVWQYNRIYNGTGRAMRFRCVWDETISYNKLLAWSNDGGDIIFYDDCWDNPNGNVNHLRWFYNHFERNIGTVFKGHPNGNQFLCRWAYNKFEAQDVKGKGPHYLIDMRDATQCEVEREFFHSFKKDNGWEGLVRMDGGTVGGPDNIIDNNKMSNIETAFLLNGAGAKMTQAFQNNAVESTVKIVNQSKYCARLDPVVVWQNDTMFLPAFEGGWRSAHQFARSTAAVWLPDTTCLNNEKSALCDGTTAPNQILLNLPMYHYKDSPKDVEIWLRVKPTEDPKGAHPASLQLRGKGASIVATAALTHTGWQTVPLRATAEDLQGLGDGGNDRFRVEYGWNNAQAIRLDVVDFIR
jgi:hypothetical protein